MFQRLTQQLVRRFPFPMLGLSKKTYNSTGWTEQTRNKFHPGDLITVFRLDYAGYSPHILLGMTELVCHVLGEGREFCKPNITTDGVIQDFYFNVLPRATQVQKELRAKHPEIAKFSDDLSQRNLHKIFKSKLSIFVLQKEIERKFGKTINVLPLNISKEAANQRIVASLSLMLNKFSRTGKLIAIVPKANGTMSIIESNAFLREAPVIAFKQSLALYLDEKHLNAMLFLMKALGTFDRLNWPLKLEAVDIIQWEINSYLAMKNSSVISVQHELNQQRLSQNVNLLLESGKILGIVPDSTTTLGTLDIPGLYQNIMNKVTEQFQQNKNKVDKSQNLKKGLRLIGLFGLSNAVFPETHKLLNSSKTEPSKLPSISR